MILSNTVTITVEPVVEPRPIGARLMIAGRDATPVAVAPIRVDRGRQHPGDAFQPAQLTVTIRGDTAVSQGDPVVFTMNAPASDPDWRSTPGTWAEQRGSWLARRVTVTPFRGVVTDVETGYVAVDGTSWEVSTRVVATDPCTDLANTRIGDEPWPVEPIADRVARVAELVGMAVVIDPAGALVAARDVDSTSALAILDELATAASSGAGVWFDPTIDALRFVTNASRQSRVPDVILTAADVLDTVRVVDSVADVVNDVTVTYVDPDDPSAQPVARATVVLPGSRRLVRHETVSTELVDPGDAYARALDHATHFARPGHRLSELTLPSELMPSRVVAEQLVTAGPALRVRLDGMPAPAPTVFDGYVEGLALDVWHDRYRVALAMSPAAWSGTLLPWSDVDPGRSWSELDPGLAWFETADALRWKETA